MADYLPPVVAKLEGDHSDLVRALRESKDKVKAWAVEVGKTKATVKVDADLTRLDAKLLQVKNKGVDLKVKLDLAAGEAARIRQKISTPAARMQVKLDLATGAKQALAQKIKQSDISVKVKPVVDQQALARVRIILAELGKRIDVSVRPGIHQPSQVAAEARLAHLARDRTATIHSVVVGGGSAGGGGRGGSAILRSLIPLAPAVVPVAASLTASALSVAASMGSATLAVGVFGLAAYSQVKQLGGLATALDTVSSAQNSNAAMSKKATADQQKALAILDAAPVATKRAAAAYGDLRDSFSKWSDSMSGFTMVPVEKSFAVAEKILPKLSPLVKGTSDQLGRLMTLAGGEVSTPGFDAAAKRFENFANGALKRGIDDVTHFSRVLGEGKAKGPVSDFMKYAEEQGPAVRQTLKDIAQAVDTVVKGAAQAGPGILTLIDGVAKLVGALPPEFVGRVMQVYTAFKLLKLTNSGVTALTGGITRLSGRLTVLRTTSAAAGGGLAGVRAAIASLSTGAKVAGVIAVIAGVALAVHALASSSKAAPDVDKMTTALGKFGRTGAVTGVLKGDLGDLSKSIAMVSKTASDNKFSKAASDLGSWIGIASGPSIGDARKNVDSLDKSMAALVQGGHSDEAAAANKRLEKAWIAAGGTAKRYVATMDDYNSALDDAAFEAKLAAESQGTFGEQAQRVQKKLDAQKNAAQGLQQAILDLNDANRAGMDAESDYQQAIDDATKAIKGHHHALSMTKGQLDLNTQAERDAYQPLSNLASTAEAAAVAAIQQGKGQDYANGILLDAHNQLVRTAEKMGLNTTEAHKLADSLDNIHDPKIMVTVYKDRAIADANAAKKALASLPKKMTTALRADAAQLNNIIRDAKAKLAALDGKTATVYIRSTYVSGVGNVYHEGGAATGRIRSGGVRRMAEGGMGRPAMMARGGSNILWGEGPDESYIPHDRRPRSKAIAEQTVGIMGGSVSWGGGGGAAGASPAATAVPLGAQVAKGLWAGMDGQSAWLAAQVKAFATRTIPEPMADALGIKSPSKVAMALGRWVGAGMVQGLTGSTASVRSATLRLSRSIQQVFHDDAQSQIAADKKRLASLAGTKGKVAAHTRAGLRTDISQQQHLMDSGISRFVAVDNARLVKLAVQRDAVAGKLKAAQDKLKSLKADWANERDTVASGILQGASVITASPDESRAVNASDVVKQMRDQAAKAKAFAAQLAQLKKKGLGADLIAQIAASGVDQGGATALALSAASKGQIDELNTTQKGLNKAADATGKTVADAMYGAGLMSARGLVKGLQSQEKAIDAQMLKIAKSMEKAIKKALGIKSPSTVMAGVGDYTAQGMAVGINRSAKHAVIAARGMAMAVRQGATLTGGSLAGAVGGHGDGGGGGGYVQNVYVTVQGSVTTERKLVDAVQAGFLKLAARNPTTYPVYRR